MNFWSVIAAAVVILKLVGVVTLSWSLVIVIAVCLLLAPWVIAIGIWLVTVVLFGAFAGILLGGAWCLDKILGKKRLKLTRGSVKFQRERSAQSQHRADRRAFR